MELNDLGHALGLPDLTEALTAVEGLMTDLLGAADASLAEPCLRILRGGGKRMRPALVMAAAACGHRPPDDPKVLAAAAAVEFMHLGSLVHDDMMDHAEDRRGVATISAREGSNAALLCGDVLFALSGHAAALVGRAAAVESAQTIVSLCNGQIREMLDTFNPARSEQAIFSSIEGKTAALLQTSCRLGAICGDLDPKAIDALGAYGHDFGMSFQLVDDVLDFVSNPALSGKPVLNDLRCGVYTLPVAIAFGQDCRQDLADALARPAPVPRNGTTPHDLRLPEAQVEAAAGILRTGDYLHRVLGLAMDYARAAADHLTCLPTHPTLRGLGQLPASYVEAQLRSMADASWRGLLTSVSGS